MIGEIEGRPPYVMFEQRSVEDRAKSQETGIYSYKDVDYVMVTPHGSKDIFEDVAENWLQKQAEHVRNKRIPPKHFEYFKSAFESYKQGLEVPLSGTPIKGWTVLSPAQQQTVIQANVRTVEDLAEANEGSLQFIGMGARALKQKAQAWLDSAETGKGANKIVDLENKLNDLTAINEKQQKQINELMAQLGEDEQPKRRGRPPKED